jgi:hypothetical protein
MRACLFQPVNAFAHGPRYKIFHFNPGRSAMDFIDQRFPCEVQTHDGHAELNIHVNGLRPMED